MTMDYKFLIEQKISELQDSINELNQMYIYYMKKKDYSSLDNISRQLYRNKYALDILNDLL